jgi:hypothetical protein
VSSAAKLLSKLTASTTSLVITIIIIAMLLPKLMFPLLGCILQWLDELLPDNAHEICRGRVTVVVTTLPDMAQV